MTSGGDPLNLVVVAGQDVLAETVADFFLEAAARSLEVRERFDVALAGGSTPKAAYRLLAAAPRSSSLDWSRVRFFFGDERCVPPDDDESNYKMAYDAMLGPLGVAAASVFRMQGEDEPAAAAQAYAALVQAELRLAAGVPAFDLIMLGLGPDGHTASLFPGTDPRCDDDALVRAPWVEKFATHRLTLTPKVINAAAEVAIATAGAGKAPAVAAVISGPREPATYPAQIVAPSPGRLTWFLDRAAATELLARAPSLAPSR